MPPAYLVERPSGLLVAVGAGGEVSQNDLFAQPGPDGLIARAQLALGKATADRHGAVSEASIWLDSAEEMELNTRQLDRVRFLRCLVLCLAGDYDTAYQIFRLANGNREVPPDWQMLGVTIFSQRTPVDGYARALEECNMAIVWSGQHDQLGDQAGVISNLYGHKAFFHLQLDQHPDAEAACKVALQLYPDYLGSYRILASIELQRGRAETAIRYLSESIVRRTGGPSFWDLANRGKAFLDIGAVPAAMRDLSRALELDPNSPAVLSNLGIAMQEAGDTSAAWKLYAQALMQDHNWAPAHHNRGVLFYNQKDFDDANRAFTRAIHGEPDNPMLWFHRGACRFELEMYGEALADLAMAGRLGYRSWELNYLMGMCHGRLKEYSTGLALLKSVTDNQLISPSILSMIWNNLGVMSHRAGDNRAAHQSFGKAVFIDPLNRHAAENIDRIESTMSGQDLQPTEETPVGIEIGPLPVPHELTPSDLLTVANIAASVVSTAVMLALL